MEPRVTRMHIRIPIEIFLQGLPILLHCTVIAIPLDLLHNRPSKQHMHLLCVLVPFLQQSHVPRSIRRPQLIIPSIDIGLCKFRREDLDLDILERRFAASKEEHWFYPWLVEREAEWDISNVDVDRQFFQSR